MLEATLPPPARYPYSCTHFGLAYLMAVGLMWQSAAGHFPPLLGGGQAVQAGLRGFDVYDRPWNSWRDRRRHRRGRKARRDYFMHRAEWSQ